MPEGLIVKSQGGFYDVAVADPGTDQDVIWCCRARGVFRKEGVTPKVGDRVSIEPGSEMAQGDGVRHAAAISNTDARSTPHDADATTTRVGTITAIHPRKNELVRPLLANLDLLFLVNAAKDPSPNVFLLDQLLATAVHQNITPVVVFTKNDLKSTEELQRLYRQAGFCVVALDHGYTDESDAVRTLKTMMAGKLSAFIGNSGVGKSTLLNLLYPGWQLQTGTISAKLGRGRHTTRHVQLHRLPPLREGASVTLKADEKRAGELTCCRDVEDPARNVADHSGYAGDTPGYVADTPGFGTMEFVRYQQGIRREELGDLFPEFRPHLGDCQFTGCSHTVERGCAVLAAVTAGEIAPSRRESYTMLYEQLRQIPDWKKR